MKRLLKSTALLEQVLHGVANGLTIQDPSGELVFVNEAAARMMNCRSPEEAVRKGGLAIAQEFTYYDTSGKPLKVTDLPGRLALSGKAEPEMTVGYTSAAHPKMRWTTIKSMPIIDDDGQVILAVNVLQDVTTLKEDEIRLKEANDRITKLLEQTLKV
jgi:PAS domain-containing protein